MRRRPKTVIMVAFATGSTTIQSNSEPAEVRAAMNVPYYETKIVKDAHGQPQTVQEPTQVTLKSITETSVREDPKSDTIQYILKNEEIVFARKDVVFWSVAEAVDPPAIHVLNQGIVSAK